MPPVISVEHLSKAYPSTSPAASLRAGRHGQVSTRLRPSTQRIGTGMVDLGHLLYSFGFVAVVFLGGVIFNRVEQTFMDTV